MNLHRFKYSKPLLFGIVFGRGGCTVAGAASFKVQLFTVYQRGVSLTLLQPDNKSIIIMIEKINLI